MKKLRLFIIAIGLVCINSISTKAQSFEWAASMGGTGADSVFSITTDANGDVYITGYFEGTADFDPGVGTFNLISGGNRDIFVQKMDVLGNLIWAKSIGGTGNDKGSSIVVDAFGDIYITGAFQNIVDFDPGVGTTNITSAGGWDIFILKLDINGNLIWAHGYGSTSLFSSGDFGNAVSTDATGNVYVTGSFGETVDFDPGTGSSILTATNNGSIFIQKFDLNGNLLWAKSTEGTGSTFGKSIDIDNSGNIYITGLFLQTVDFDPGTGTFNLTSQQTNGWDIFIQKLDANGNFNWVKAMNGNGLKLPNAITIDNSGNVYSTGDFFDSVDFDPGTGVTNFTANFRDSYVQKLDVNGNLLWVKQIGADRSFSIASDVSGNVYITGAFGGTVDFDPGSGVFNMTANGWDEVFLLKLDGSGNFAWAKSAGGTGSDLGKAITIDVSGNVYVTGSYAGLADLNPNAGVTNFTSNGSGDVFVIKLGSTVSIDELENENTFSLYPNPVNHQLTINDNDLIIKEIAIIDITGKTVKSIPPKSIIINVSGLSKGIYFLQLTTDESIKSQKFIKN